ncbi:MAG TPA: hypothetical protein VHB97_15735, partial [Polyangia bacterium]|nr:hypothetical protein [Polyangia bacterium]
MRLLFALFACLAAGCPNPTAPPSSFSGDNCTPGSATLTSLAVAAADGGKPVAVGDRWYPGMGAQGLQMSQFDLDLTGELPGCVQVNVRAERAVLDGPKLVDGKGAIEIFIGPVDDSYDIEADV